MRKRVLICMSFVMVCGLIGCSHSNESKSEQNDGSSSKEKNHEASLTHNEKPPLLTITVGVEAESLPPIEIINAENAVSVNLKKTIKLNFENEPMKYEIRAYDKNNRMFATYHDFNDVKEKRKTIYEIAATWDNGKAIYVVALGVQ